MKKFSFEFEKILEFRNFEKNTAEGELAKAISVENQINENLEKIAQNYFIIKSRMKGSLNFDDVISATKYQKLLDFQKEELLNQLSQAKIITEQKRQVLQECIKKTTALEKLEEKQLEKYKNLENYEEAEMIDDIAVMNRKK